MAKVISYPDDLTDTSAKSQSLLAVGKFCTSPKYLTDQPKMSVWKIHP